MHKLAASLLLGCLLAPCGRVQAHEVRPAYLELEQTSADLYQVLWKVPARGEDERLALYVRFPAGTATASETRASSSSGGFVERWTIRRAGGLEGQDIAISGLSATRTDVLVRLRRLDGTTQIARLTPDQPSFIVERAQSTVQLARTYLELGIEHILGGIDHLLFVLALLLLIGSQWLALAKTITAFTVAHSITLTLAALGVVHVPQPPVEVTIALSIVFVARELVRAQDGVTSLTARSPWVVSFAFGLLHGFGFAGALQEVGLPQREIPMALLCFNVGVEVGQLLFVAAALGAWTLARRARLNTPVWLTTATHYALGTVATFWLLQRMYPLHLLE